MTGQLFQNSICPPAEAASDEDLAQLERDVGEGPSHASALNCDDGYAARGAVRGRGIFRPACCARRQDCRARLQAASALRLVHYRYVLDGNGPRIEQVGIGARDTLSPMGLNFRPPAAAPGRASSAVAKAPPLKSVSGLRPRYISFSDAGLNEALERGVRLAAATRAVDINLAFWTRDFDQIVFETMQGRVDSDWLCETVTTCRHVERELRESIAEMLLKHGRHGACATMAATTTATRGGADPLAGLEPLQSFSAAGDLAETRMAIAAVRMALGAMAEAAFVKETVKTCWVMPKPGRATVLGKSKVAPEAWAATADGKRQLCAARLYNDAAIVATWTSAHTAFVDDCQLGVLEAPSPSIFTVLSSFTEFNFSDLLARRVAPKHKDLKDALPVLSLLTRGLHTSARGWDVLLSQFVPKSTCVRTIVGRALAVSCTGMHENVHPALRLPWRRRHVALKLLFRECTSKRLPELTKTATTATREAVRRLLMSTVACMPAATRALALSSHPIRMLQAPRSAPQRRAPRPAPRPLPRPPKASSPTRIRVRGSSPTRSRMPSTSRWSRRGSGTT